MSATSLGFAALIALVAAASLTPLPSQPIAALLLGLGALWLERGGLDLDDGRRHRFSPASPVYLAMGMSSGVGAALAGLFMLVDAVSRLDRGFMLNLAHRLPVALALMVGSGVRALAPDSTVALYLSVPLAFFLAESALRQKTPPGQGVADRQVQRQLQLRIRPLEFALALVSPLLAFAADAHPALLLCVLPILACSHLAAENAMLTAHDETIAAVLEKLRGARAQTERVALQRDKALQEKQILEGFSQQLAGQPELSAVASNLVATVHKLMPVDSVVVFLGTPPEPFTYRVGPAQLAALQGAHLTGLREPLVDRAVQQQKPVLQKKPPSVEERLLTDDVIAGALPLGKVGVLYVGRSKEQGFAPTELDRLKWLAGKATLALESAFQTHEQARQRRQREQTVHRLERQVAWLSQLIGGAEAMASSLDRKVLMQRFTASLGQVVPHSGGLLLLEGLPPARWGQPLQPHPEMLSTARGIGRPLVIEDAASSRFGVPGQGIASLVASPLLAGQECVGLVLLGAEAKAGFAGEQVDLLFLLCSQAAMALSHAGLYTEVVEARRQLEESQASLVQSSKLTAIGQMAAGVAHELNSPLGAISLSVGEALNSFEVRPELSKKLLGRAQAAVLKAKEIVNRLMAYSRKPDHRPRTLSMESVVRETVEFLAFQLKSATVETEIVCDGPTLVSGEEQPLQQVVTNLLLNAAQAMEETPPQARRLRVELSTDAEQVVMRVQDAGSGISEENLQRIFDPFFTTKPVGRGTGLGLWACQQIVTQHDGTMEVESTPGQGSLFIVRLPQVSAPPDLP